MIWNLILPLIAASAVFIKQHRLRQSIISLMSILLVINNGLILLKSNSNTLVLTNIFDHYQLALTVEPLAIIFALMVSILYCATNFYSFFYLKAQELTNLGQDLHPKIHFFFMPIAIMASIAIGYAANLLTLFVFYEILTLSTYPLVVQSFSETARKAGKIYLTTLLGSSTFFLMFALIFLDHHHGHSSFKLGGIFEKTNDIKEFILLLVCFVFGFSKSAIFPLYKWLPKAMVAPVPVSALLHAVAVVKSGIFALIKIFVYLFGIDYLHNIHQSFPWAIDWLTILACFTIIFAGFMASRQNSLKKILAYSTISQLSYLILALSFTTSQAIIVAFLQMLAHSLAKITLFFSAGIIYIALHKSKVSEMQGIFKIIPVPVLLFIAGSLSIMGLPLSIGFLTLSKLYKTIPSGEIGILVIFCLTVSSIFSCYYFAKTIFQMLRPAAEIEPINYEVNNLSIITAVTFLLSLVLAFYLNDIAKYLEVAIT